MRNEPSVWEKIKGGAILGGGLGASVGVVFGSVVGFMNRKEVPFFETLGKTTISTSATFAVFVAVGSVLRSSNELMHLTRDNKSVFEPRPEMRYRRIARPVQPHDE